MNTRHQPTLVGDEGSRQQPPRTPDQRHVCTAPWGLPEQQVSSPIAAHRHTLQR
jgi:hypothetical protein